MRKFCIFILMTAPLLTACAQHKDPSQQQAAMTRWNDARSAVLLGLAKDEYDNQNFEKARQTVDEAIQMSPNSAVAHVLSGRLYIEQGQLEAAERELATARQLDAANAECDYLSGVVYQRWQQPQEALEFYEHASAKAPAELAYLLARAEMLVALDQRGQALALLQQKVTYFEHSGAIRDAVGLILVQQNRLPEAVEMLRRASILSPDDLTIREHLGTAMYEEGNYSDAIEVLSPLLKEDGYQDRGDLWAALGESQMENGQPSDAVDSLTTATDTLPNSAGVWLSLAKAQMQQGSLRLADISLRRSLSLDSGNSQAYLLQGYLQLRLEHLPDALEAFRLASRLDQSDTVSLCMIGLTLDKLGRAKQAAAFYQRALQLNPHDQMAAQLMARLDSHE
ncbi:MAG: tetratricopeptide repeat protein [Tepidisphaeraceae bacterium]|jgi:tetratricopeptide (TPR) repeat protein